MSTHLGTSCRPQSPSRRRAFTLLELIISTVLMAVLLAATWALLGIYQGQFEKSQDRVERWQLIRSLQSQLTDDLKACHLPGSAMAADASQRPPNIQATADPPDGQGAALDTLGSDALAPESYSPDNSASDGSSPGMVAMDGDQSSVSSIVGEWMSPVVGLEGTKDALILDILAPTHPRDARNGTGPRPGDRVSRVVYAFADPLSAVVEGRPAGLVRCELKAHELQSLLAAHVGGVELYALIHQIQSSRHDPTGTGRPGESETGNDVRSAAASKLPLSGFETIDVRQLDEDVVQRIDMVPEMTSFRLSYFDGHQWHSSWSYSQRLQLPIAVELRFDLAKPASIEESQDGDPRVAAERLLRERNEAADALARPTDDRIRSAQAAAPIGYRWLVYLAGQDQQEPEPVEKGGLAYRDSMP